MFPTKDHPIIDLSKIPLHVIGYKNGQKHYKIVYLLEANKPMLGMHKVKVDGMLYLTNSLSSFKRDFLGFEDKVAFDRAAFIIHENPDWCVRLKYIRNRVKLPAIQYHGQRPIDPNPSTPTLRNVPILQKNEVLKYTCKKSGNTEHTLKFYLRKLYRQNQRDYGNNANYRFKKVVHGIMKDVVPTMQFNDDNDHAANNDDGIIRTAEFQFPINYLEMLEYENIENQYIQVDENMQMEETTVEGLGTVYTNEISFLGSYTTNYEP